MTRSAVTLAAALCFALAPSSGWGQPEPPGKRAASVTRRAAPDPRDPEAFRRALLEVSDAIERASGLAPVVSERIAAASADDLRPWLSLLPDPARFLATANRIADRDPAPGAALRASTLASTPFSPDYPPNSGAYKFTILDTLSAPPLSIPVSNTQRCDTATWDDFFEVWYLTAYTIGQLEGACTVGGCDPTGVVCLATCTPLELAKIFLDLAVVPVQLCDVHDGSVNAAEIEAGYENSVRILGDLATHDANIDGDLAAHDARLVVHDAEVQARLAAIETALQGLRRISLQVVEVRNRDAYLVAATEGGRPVPVTFQAIEVFDERERTFTVIGGAAAAEVEQGSYLVTLNLSPQHPDKIFRFRVRHDGIAGEVVFHRLAGQTLGAGQ